MELDIGVNVNRSTITFTSTETDAVFLILGHLPGFVKDDIAVSINESRTKININGDNGKTYLIQTEVSQRVRITHEVSIQGFSEDFLIPGGVNLDRIDVGFEEEEAILVITLPKVESQEQELAQETGKEIQLDLQETDIWEEKELEDDCENLEQEFEWEIETIDEKPETDELEITIDQEILQTESEIDLDLPEAVSDIKLEDPELQQKIKEDPKPDYEIIPEDPEINEVPNPDIEIKQVSQEVELEMNEESKPEENLEERDKGNTENEIHDPEIEIRKNPSELEPETIVKPQEIETKTKSNEKEDDIVEDAPQKNPTSDPNLDLPKPIDKSEPHHDEQQDLGQSTTPPPLECDPDSEEIIDKEGPEPSEQPETIVKPQEIETKTMSNEKENDIVEDAPQKNPTSDPNLDLPKPIGKSEPHHDEQQDLGQSITPPLECDPDSKEVIDKEGPETIVKPQEIETKTKYNEKGNDIVEDAPQKNPTSDLDLPKPIDKSEPHHDEQQDLGQSITPPPLECDPDSKEAIDKEGPEPSQQQVQEDPFIPPSQSDPEQNSIRPIDKNKPDQNEQQFQEDQPTVCPMSDPEPDSPKSVQREESSSEEEQAGSDQENEVHSKETEAAKLNGKESRMKKGRGKKPTLYPSMIAGSVFIMSLMALFMHVLKNKRHPGTGR